MASKFITFDQNGSLDNKETDVQVKQGVSFKNKSSEEITLTFTGDTSPFVGQGNSIQLSAKSTSDELEVNTEVGTFRFTYDSSNGESQTLNSGNPEGEIIVRN